MPGITTTTAVANSLPSMRFGARSVLESKAGMRYTVDLIKLPKNQGNTWAETDFAKISAQTVSETDDLLDNPQQLSDTLNSITPGDNGIHVLYTDRVADRVISDAAGIIRSGVQAMNAIMRQVELNLITTGQGASVDMGTAGNPLQSVTIRSARSRVSANSTEGAMGPTYMQHHGFCLKDIEDELVAAVGTYEISSGVTADVFGRSFTAAPRMIGDVIVQENNLIAIDSADDAEGFVYDKNGIIHVEGRGARTEYLRRPNIGGGATSVFMYFESASGFRSSGNWQKSITADASNPS